MKYSYKKVKKQAIKDGRRWKWKLWPFFKVPKEPIPYDNQNDHAFYEITLKKAADSELATVSHRWANIDRNLKQRYCRALQNLKNAQGRLKEETEKAEDARKRYEEALQNFLAIEKPYLSSGWKYFLLIIIGLAEFPLNGIVFSIFGAGRIETYIMAASMCIAIPWAGHFVGKTLRQEKILKKDWVLFIVVLLAVFLGLVALSIIRAQYLAEMLKELGLSLSPTFAGVIFIIINLLIFVVACLVSYEGHLPKHTEYIRIKNAFENIRKEFWKKKAEAKKANRNHERANQKFQQAKVKREKSHNIYKVKGEKVKKDYEWLVQVYRDENIRTRGGQRPKCFELPILGIELPLDLSQEIDWSC